MFIHNKYKNIFRIDMKIDLYCVCWNEIKILPFVIDYWKRYVNHAYVYDNNSDDGTYEYLKQFDWITVYRYNTDDQFNDKINMNIKNETWKNNTEADWIVCCDMDEVLYSTDINKFLTYCTSKNIDIISPTWNEVYYWDFPEYKENFVLHENADKIYYKNDGFTHKPMIFNRHTVTEMRYAPGAHTCNPNHAGRHLILYDKDNADFKLYHLKNLGIDYKYQRDCILEERMSQLNRIMGWGIHYKHSYQFVKDDFEKVINN